MRRDLFLIGTVSALACSLTLLGVVGAGLYLGRLRIAGDADPLSLSIDAEGAQMAVIYPIGDARDVDAMQAALKGGRR